MRRLAWASAWVAVTTLAAPANVAALQMAYTAANGPTSLVPWQSGFLTFDLAEIRVGLTFDGRLDLGDPEGREADQFDFGVHGSASARHGQRDVFSKLNFTPGVDVGARAGFVLRHGGSAHDVVFVRGRYAQRENPIIQTDTVAGVTSLLEVMQHTAAGAVGYNHGFSEYSAVGISLEVRREFASPGLQPVREFCTPGSTPRGTPAIVCSDRFVGPVNDLWAGQVRVDITVALRALGSADRDVRLSLVTAGALDFHQGSRRELNVALGPALHICDNPGQPLLTLLLGLRDAFDANGLPSDDPLRGSYFNDHFLLRLVLAAPFRTFDPPGAR